VRLARLAALWGTIGCAAVFLVAGISMQAGASLPDVPEAGMRSTLSTTALRFAALNGATAPTSARVVLSQRDIANALMAPGTEMPTTEPVYVVQMEGKFVGHMAKIPPGASLPTGDALWFVVSPVDGQVTDWGISSSPADLSKLGQVSSLDLAEPTSS
jgi:hypothetical protein